MGVWEPGGAGVGVWGPGGAGVGVWGWCGAGCYNFRVIVKGRHPAWVII